jgi:hypothetical protein
MKSLVAITSEIDNLELAVQELVSQVKEKQTLGSNSVGIAYCDADTNVAGLGKLLHAELGIDIIGITTIASVERHCGYYSMGILLCVMTADNVSFSVGCTGELSKDSFSETIREEYTNARSNIQDDPKLILTLAPYIPDITSDNYMEILDEASGGVAVFGGVATDHYELKHQKTFFNDKEFKRSLVFLLIAGDVKPVFALEHHLGNKTEIKAVVTQATENFIQKVGDQTFKDFLSVVAPVPDEELVAFYYQTTPFIVELPDYEEDEQPVVRGLLTIDHKTGAGGFLSKIPEGSTIYMDLLKYESLGVSCNGAMSGIIREMDKNKDYEYSMLFISTCNARHLLMANTKNLESDIISERLKGYPSELNAMGFYSFGEFCPTGTRADGTAKNRFHNISFVVCAI